MNFASILESYEQFDFDSYFSRLKDCDIRRILAKEKLSELDFLALLSPTAEKFLDIAKAKARVATRRHFGRTMSLYAPLYLSNYCVNECLYCGFKRSTKIKRRKLEGAELLEEADSLAASGIRNVLVLTGESRKESPVSYIADCISAIAAKFATLSVEIYPLEAEEYRQLNSAGAEGITLYQETYDRKLYAGYHKNCPKGNFDFRLEAHERALEGGMRAANVGALLGLCEFRKDFFFAGLHADFLMRKFPGAEIGVAVPRLNAQGPFVPPFPVSDTNIAQAIVAFRLFLPSSGISLSTRERSELRDSLLECGITRLSAGSRTEVGGYGESDMKTEAQFDVNDRRNVEEICAMLKAKNYDPVFTDWRRI